VKFIFIYLLISSSVFFSCQRTNTDPGSKEYQELESITYIDIMDSLLKINLWDYNEFKNKVPIYDLNDSLFNFNHFFEYSKYKAPYGPYLKINPASRPIPENLKSITGKYNFCEKRRYPNNNDEYDSLLKEINSRIDTGKYFTGTIVTLSRICYNETFDRGYFYYCSWKGPRAEAQFIISIQKISKKWKICDIDMNWIE